MEFSEFFTRATGHPPHAFQQRLASSGLTDLLSVPMGCGKSLAVISAWSWRLTYGPAEVKAATPRRLVVALPMRTLVDQFEREARCFLQDAGLSDDIDVHVVMGGRRSDEHSWRLNPQRPSIVVGTVDCLVSKALLRGYGITRSTYPIDFALIMNGSHIVIDEIQLASASTVTLRQLAGFRARYGGPEPFGLTCMSATVHPTLLDTVDNSADGLETVALEDSDRSGHLARVLDATRTVRRLPIDDADERAIAAHAVARHHRGTRTLVVVNTVKAAKAIFKALQRLKPEADTLLIHSRFRGVERARLTERLVASPPPAGMIAVATQVIEAGVDLDSAVLITEAAPWPSVCQRSGRCNRYGEIEDAELWWYSGTARGPYEQGGVDEAVRLLQALEGEACTSERLLDQPATAADLALRVIRRPDFLALFDTAPDLSGVDIDIAPYIREGTTDLDCQVAWLELPPGSVPDAGSSAPSQEWRCPVPVGEARMWAREVRALTFDVVTERWEPVRGQTRIRPGEIILAPASSGGYDPDSGFDPSSRAPVPVEPADHDREVDSEESDAMSADVTNVSATAWTMLDDHLQQTADQARGLLHALDAAIPEGLADAVVAAALAHDIGKAHQGWQQALRETAGGDHAPEGLLAKSPGHGRLTVSGRRGFRHELLSALMVERPESSALRRSVGIGDASVPLVRYLVAAHHGKIRMQARQPLDSVEVTDGLFGLRDGDSIPDVRILEIDVPGWQVDLATFELGTAGNWSATALALLDQLGPFTFAYLEMLVRIADWRASAGRVVVGEEAQVVGR